MKDWFVLLCVVGLTTPALAQTPATPAQTMPTQATAPKAGDSRPESSASASGLEDMFQAKIKAEWEALKNKDKKAYGELLADDYQGVEVDGKGERTKLQALNELADTNLANYTLWGFKLIPLGPGAALVIYESTIQFPPKSAIRYSRVYISELWVKRAGQWKEVHYQETHVK
jgi:hypothetical protein